MGRFTPSLTLPARGSVTLKWMSPSLSARTILQLSAAAGGCYLSWEWTPFGSDLFCLKQEVSLLFLLDIWTLGNNMVDVLLLSSAYWLGEGCWKLSIWWCCTLSRDQAAKLKRCIIFQHLGTIFYLCPKPCCLVSGFYVLFNTCFLVESKTTEIRDKCWVTGVSPFPTVILCTVLSSNWRQQQCFLQKLWEDLLSGCMFCSARWLEWHCQMDMCSSGSDHWLGHCVSKSLLTY